MAERSTGMRNFDLSNRHRQWHSDLYMTDLDYVSVEYSIKHGVVKLAAIVEYKHIGADLDRYQRQVLVLMGDAAQVPAYLVLYSYKLDLYTVHPLNALAGAPLLTFVEKLKKDANKEKFVCVASLTGSYILNEFQYVYFLHVLKGDIAVMKDTRRFKREYTEEDESKVHTIDSRKCISEIVTNQQITREIYDRSISLKEPDIDLSSIGI